MTLKQLVDQLLTAGVVLADNDSDILMQGPVSILTPEVIAALRTHKQVVLDYLRATTTPPIPLSTTRPDVCWCCGTGLWWSVGNGHWVCGACHPPPPGVAPAGLRWWTQTGRASEVEVN